MNPIEMFHGVLTRIFVDARLTLEKPLYPDGFWSLDVRLADYLLSIEWREADGFGLTADPDHGYGEGSDEVYHDVSTALMRVLQLVENRLGTIPPWNRLGLGSSPQG